ncbi:MAG: hypothetical protein ACFFCW_39695 [Candidatus Hodarchaeota archaeon]
MSTSIKIRKASKRKIEEIQARIVLELGERRDQFEILEAAVDFVLEHYEAFRNSKFLENRSADLDPQRELQYLSSLIVDCELIDQRAEDEIIYE